jgi:hypothetical protein
MDFAQLFPGRFIKAGQFRGEPWTGTIAGIRLEALIGKNGKETKPIIAFKECLQEWVVNKTNGECIKAMWGRDTAAWMGHRVTLFPAPYEGDVAIRVAGSPDLEKPMEIVLQLAGKLAFPVTLQVTSLVRLATDRDVDELARARSLVREVGSARAAGGGPGGA